MYTQISLSQSIGSGLSCRYGNDNRPGIQMDLSTTQRLLKAMQAASIELGVDTTFRQMQMFLLIATAGSSGTDAGSLERRTRSSQAAVSRTTGKFGPPTARDPDNLNLIDMTVDPADRRRVYYTLNAKGRQVLARINKHFD